MDRTTVTNAEFARFVEATQYVALAERPLGPALYPGARPEMLEPGALFFRMTEDPVDTADIANWRHWTKGAQGGPPEGPRRPCASHPVVKSRSRTPRPTPAGACQGSCRSVSVMSE